MGHTCCNITIEEATQEWNINISVIVWGKGVYLKQLKNSISRNTIFVFQYQNQFPRFRFVLRHMIIYQYLNLSFYLVTWHIKRKYVLQYLAIKIKSCDYCVTIIHISPNFLLMKTSPKCQIHCLQIHKRGLPYRAIE